ncbi:MAG: alpha/beta hydrolase [Candidatus Cloacimonetes bacterium]|nr:alpha/beta hydrolase [Candidatus Cloacimonadota bacterium]
MRGILQLIFKILIFFWLPFVLILCGLWFYRDYQRNLLASEFVIDEPGFIGVEQDMVVLRRGYEQPAILFFHGGPARPESAFAPQILKDLAQDSALYFWDQTGSGLAYQGTDFSRLSWEQLKETSEDVFKQIASKHQKVFLSGHGYGCLLALHVARTLKQDVAGLILTSPLLYPLQDLLDARTYMMEMAKNLQNSRAYAQLDEISLPLSVNEAIRIEQWVSRLGGEIYQRGAYREALRLSWYSPFYDLNDLWNLDRSIIHSIPRLFPGLMEENLSTLTKLDVSVLLLLGERDFRIPKDRVQLWFSNLDAVHKKEVRFKEAAHYPQVEATQDWMAEVRMFVSRNPEGFDESAATDPASGHAEKLSGQNP